MIKLTKIQEEICKMLLEDKSNKEMADLLGITLQDIKMLISSTIKKYGAKTKTGLALAYYRDITKDSNFENHRKKLKYVFSAVKGNFNNKIFFDNKEERIKNACWLGTYTLLSNQKILDLTSLHNEVERLASVITDPIKNNRLSADEISFWEQYPNANYDAIKKIYNTPIETIYKELVIDLINYDIFMDYKVLKANLDDLWICDIQAIRVVKLYFLVKGHNAWWGSWSSKFNWDGSLHFNFYDAKHDAEKQRTQGRVFTITEIPAICFYTNKGAFFIACINNTENKPFSLFHYFSNIQQFMNQLEKLDENYKYPQYLLVHNDKNILLDNIDNKTQFHQYKSYIKDGVLHFSSTNIEIKLECLCKTFNTLIKAIQNKSTNRRKIDLLTILNKEVMRLLINENDKKFNLLHELVVENDNIYIDYIYQYNNERKMLRITLDSENLLGINE